MERLKGDDEAGLNALMDRHGPGLFHFLIRMIGDESDAEEIAQEAFVRVYQNRNKFNPNQRFSTWLFAIAANLAKNRLRWRGRHPEVSLDQEPAGDCPSLLDKLSSSTPCPSQVMERSERSTRIQKAVAALDEDLRLPLVLAEFENLSHIEIAAVVGCTAKAVEMRLYRARRELRERLAGFISEG